MRLVSALCCLAACSGGGTGSDTATTPDTDTPTDTDVTDTDATTPSDPCAAPVTLAIDNDEAAFSEPLAAGSAVTMVFGPQGGWHIWFAGDVGGASQNVTVDTRVTQKDTGVVIGDATVALALRYFDAEACTGQFAGVYGYLNAMQPASGSSYLDYICSLEGDTLTLEVTVTDAADGDVGVATVDVRAALDPANVAYCHAR